MKIDYRNNNKNTSRKLGNIKLKVIVLTGIILMSLFATQLVFANNLATDGEKLTLVRNEITKIESENMMLRQEIAQESSLANLQKESASLGFKKPDKIIIL